VKVTVDKIENRQAHLTAEMDQAELDEGLNRAYSRLVRKYNVPGFRKGKTPRPILEQYLGKAAFLEDAVEHMAPDAYEKAVKEQDLKPIARPQIELEKTEPVTYKMIVPLEPVVKLGEYHQLKAAKESIQLKEEDTTNAIEQLRHQHAIWEPVDRQVNSRDLVTLDIESQVESLPFINQKDAEFEVVKESEFPVKGFAEELIGLKKGQSKEFKLSFAADYQRTELAGKEATFKVDIKEIKQEKLPEVDDDFAKQVNPEFKTAEELRTKVTENLKQNAEEKAKKDFEQKMIDEVVGLSEIEYPQIVVESEIDQLIREQMRRWQMDDKGMDEYLKTIKHTPEQLREELRPVAERTVKQSLVLTEVAKAEKIEVNEADYKSEVENMTREMAGDRKDKMIELLNLPQSQVSLASAIATRKTVNKLAEFVAGSSLSEPKSENIETKESETKEKEAQA